MLPKRLHLILISLLIGSLPAQTLPASPDGASPDTAHASINHALLFRPAGLAFFPESRSPQQQPAAMPAPPPQGPGWARRHLLLFAGMAMTGGGAALVAGGGPGQGERQPAPRLDLTVRPNAPLPPPGGRAADTSEACFFCVLAFRWPSLESSSIRSGLLGAG